MEVKSIFRGLLSAGMVSMGILHFAKPAPFVAAMPSYLPWHLALVQVSGFFEVLGGVGLLVPQVRKAAGWGLILLYIAVFPANINMALHPVTGATSVMTAILWLRLPLQLLLIMWARWVSAPSVLNRT